MINEREKSMHVEVQPHIRIGEIEAKYALLPGDPGRVERVARYLDDPREVAYNREYRSVLGRYKGIPVLVISTGIGGPSVGIAVEELSRIGVTTMIRIGSCGALQAGMRLGDLVIANGAVRNDGTSDTYIERGYPAVPNTDLLMRLLETVKGMGFPYVCGLVRSHDSFYTDLEEEIDRFWRAKGIVASDMETAALFVVGGLRKLRVASILNVVVEAEGELERGINQYVEEGNMSVVGEEREIRLALETIFADANQK